eukprot:882643-Rhodomonas_salina.1
MNQGTAIQPSMDGSDGRSRPPALVRDVLTSDCTMPSLRAFLGTAGSRATCWGNSATCGGNSACEQQ